MLLTETPGGIIFSCISYPLFFSYALFRIIFSKEKSLLSWPFAIGGAIWSGYVFYQYFFGVPVYSPAGMITHSASFIVTFTFLYFINRKALKAKEYNIGDEVDKFSQGEERAVH